jgi:hypothetical protein
MSKLAVLGGIVLIIGAIGSFCVHFSLALTDSEYAKHDESLYATFQYFAHGGWIFTILVIVGMLLWICFRER